MTNKKILFVFLAGVFLMLAFSGFTAGATKQVKVDWDGNPFEWCSDTDDHNVERCAYDENDKNYMRVCEEDGDFDSSSSCGSVQYPYCIQEISSNWNYIVYNNWWYTAKCKNPLVHTPDVGKHYGNFFGTDDGDNDYEPLTNKPALFTCYDYDGDGYYSQKSHPAYSLSLICGDYEPYSCDNSASNFPGNTESCSDSIDNDCDGFVNNGCAPAVTYCPDTDGDGYVNTASGCSVPSGKQAGDCDDSNSAVNPGATEIPGNSVDENCDGIIVTGIQVGLPYYCDADGDTYKTAKIGGYGTPPSGCAATQGNDCIDKPADCDDYYGSGKIWEDLNPFGAYSICQIVPQNIHPGTTGLCNGIDNDCDGQIRENCNQVYWAWENGNQIPTVNVNEISVPSQADKFKLILDDPYPTGTNWTFRIFEDDGAVDEEVFSNPVAATIAGNKIYFEWTPTQAQMDAVKNNDANNIFEFYFVAILTTSPSSFNSYFNLNQLKIEWLPSGGPPSETCSDGIKNQGETGTDCGGPCDACDGDACTGDDECVSGNCDSGVCTTGGGGGGEVLCEQYLTCLDYPTETLCEDNTCERGPLLDDVDCTAPDIECGCAWNDDTSECYSYSDSIDSTTGDTIGTCIFAEMETSNCETDDSLEYSITAEWSGAESDKPSYCTGGTFGPILCSAKTKLPFESRFGILLAIIAIAGIYFIAARINKLKEKRKRKS